jgi:hypothetical protein
VGGQDHRLGQLDAAAGAVDAYRVEEDRAIRADLEAEIVITEKADQCTR